MAQKNIAWEQQLDSCKSIDELWNVLGKIMSGFGVTSIFYGFGYSSALMIKEGGMTTLWFRTNHPPDYLDYFDRTFNIEDDMTAVHCITESAPFIWHDTSLWEGKTDRQIRFMEESARFGMEVGVTLPFHFDHHGVAGMGLSFPGMSTVEFDSFWRKSGEEVIAIAGCFDHLVRNRHIGAIFKLSPREIEALTLLSRGNPPKAIAGLLGTSASTVEKQIRSARKKLNAKTTEQAISKALILKVIAP